MHHHIFFLVVNLAVCFTVLSYVPLLGDRFSGGGYRLWFCLLSVICWWVLALAVANVEYPFFYVNSTASFIYNGTVVSTVLVSNSPEVYVYRVETAYLGYLFMGIGIIQMLYAVSIILGFLVESVEVEEEEE
jgi:hypothetical protein